MQFDWRSMSGPALAAAAALLAVIVDRHLKGAPYPAPLFVCIVALAGSLSGLASAATSGAIAIGCSALFFFNRHAPPGYDSADLMQMAMLSIAVGTTAAIIGLLRQRRIEALLRERLHHASTERLSAALDHMNIGIVLLDADTRAEFINRAFRNYFSLPDEKADSRPPFVALMYHGRATRAYELPEDELNAYVARRMEMVRTGDSTPINIKLADGKVLRFSCTALPDGGRMLSYTPVTDLVRDVDEPSSGADDFYALRGGHYGLIHHLRAAE
jgi:PAS domain-containing protein